MHYCEIARSLSIDSATVSRTIKRTQEFGHNGRRKNDRIWSKETPRTSAVVEHRQNPQPIMVWGGICASGKTPPVQINLNQEVYCRDILESVIQYAPLKSALFFENGRS